jgi:hypothetical protein
VLYMNLRPRTDYFVSPERDNTPASILTGNCQSEEYFDQCCAFFCAIFKLIRDDLLARLSSDQDAVVKNWNKDMDMRLKSKYRKEFFKRLQSTFDEVGSEILTKCQFLNFIGRSGIGLSRRKVSE